MSYDLEARANDKYGQTISREQAHSVIGLVPGARPNGPAGFTVERGDNFYLEVDVEYVNEDGDNLEENVVSEQINCIRFHIPAAFQNLLNVEIKVAQEIADGIGWPLIDLQTGEVASALGDVPQSCKPWWMFWK
jgi:hypothetical protein